MCTCARISGPCRHLDNDRKISTQAEGNNTKSTEKEIRGGGEDGELVDGGAEVDLARLLREARVEELNHLLLNLRHIELEHAQRQGVRHEPKHECERRTGSSI